MSLGIYPCTCRIMGGNSPRKFYLVLSLAHPSGFVIFEFLELNNLSAKGFSFWGQVPFLNCRNFKDSPPLAK